MAYGNDATNTAQLSRTTPTFDPRGAFAWTRRGGELARLAAQEERSKRSRRYETPTFEPRSAFARTLRGGEVARLERQSRIQLSDVRPPHVALVA